MQAQRSLAFDVFADDEDRTASQDTLHDMARRTPCKCRHLAAKVARVARARNVLVTACARCYLHGRAIKTFAALAGPRHRARASCTCHARAETADAQPHTNSRVRESGMRQPQSPISSESKLMRRRGAIFRRRPIGVSSDVSLRRPHVDISICRVRESPNLGIKGLRWIW